MTGSAKPINHNWYGSPALAKPCILIGIALSTLSHHPPSPLLPFPFKEKGKKGEPDCSLDGSLQGSGGRRTPARPLGGLSGVLRPS
jgi:hypothetical protein